MQKIQLYIQGQRVELFKDESVTITDSIQNVKDIGKVFTAFSKSFSVPASKANNKTFNLTAFVQNGVIQVKPLDDFYTGTNTYDITEFVDVNSSKVDVALPFKEVRFKFKDTKTFLANKFSELNNRNWGYVCCCRLACV